MLKNNGRQERRIIGRFGEIAYYRTKLVPVDDASANLLYSMEGRKAVYPLDHELKLDSLPFKVTHDMMCRVAREAVRARSFQEACDEIEEKYHIRLSKTLVQSITEYVANCVFEEQAKLADVARQTPYLQSSQRERRKIQNDVLYIEVDGAMVFIKDKDGAPGWMESKHAIAFHSSDVTVREKDGERYSVIQKRDYMGYIGPASEFKYYLLSFARANGYDTCSEVVGIGDGAMWIQGSFKEHLPFATFILDLYHAKQAAWTFANAVRHGKSAIKYAETLCEMIENGDVNGVLAATEKYKGRKMPDGVSNLYTYVLNHKDCMNYPEYISKGYFVGSGAIESSNKIVMQNRLKLPGMRWTLAGAQRMLTLKAKFEADKWQEVIDLVGYKIYGKDYVPSLDSSY